MKEIIPYNLKAQQEYLDLINQVFEIEKKLINLNEENSILRNINKIKSLIENDIFKNEFLTGLIYHDPIGEDYSDTRTDCSATISGEYTDNLEIIEVIKPIIYAVIKANENIQKIIVQQAIVIVTSKNN